MKLPYNGTYSPNAPLDFDNLKDQLLGQLNSLPKSQGGTFENRMRALGALEGERAIWTRAISRFNQVNGINIHDEKRTDFIKQQMIYRQQEADTQFWNNNKDLDPNYNYSQAFLASRMSPDNSTPSVEDNPSPYKYVTSLLGNHGMEWKEVDKQTMDSIKEDSQPIKDTERFFQGVDSNSPQQKYDDLVDNYNTGKFDGIY